MICRNAISCAFLIEYGLKPWEEKTTVAEHIFSQLKHFSFNNPDLAHLYKTYTQQYNQGLEPTAKTLMYDEDEKIRNTVVSVTFFPFELSKRWDEKTGTTQSLNRDTSTEDVIFKPELFLS